MYESQSEKKALYLNVAISCACDVTYRALTTKGELNSIKSIRAFDEADGCARFVVAGKPSQSQSRSIEGHGNLLKRIGQGA